MRIRINKDLKITADRLLLFGRNRNYKPMQKRR